MTTNELKLAKAFRDAGFPQDKAEAVSQTIFDAIRDNVATKGDLAASEQALRSDVTLVRKDLAIAEQRLKIWTGGVAAAAVSALFAALHYWPPHT
jgi:hypothetical protein